MLADWLFVDCYERYAVNCGLRVQRVDAPNNATAGTPAASLQAGLAVIVGVILIVTAMFVIMVCVMNIICIIVVASGS